MDDKTLEALKASIGKWERKVKGLEIDLGTTNCPLCQLFFRNRCRGSLFQPDDFSGKLIGRHWRYMVPRESTSSTHRAAGVGGGSGPERNHAASAEKYQSVSI